MVLQSNMVLSGAALDAQQTMEEYMVRSHNARAEGDDASANEYWEQAVKYEKIRNSILADYKHNNIK